MTERDTMSFENKVVWITGASSGIGEALAYEYARAGAKLILSSRNEAELDRVCMACMNADKHVIIRLDLEQYPALEELSASVWEEHGPMDVLINNGGVSQKYLVAESTLELDKKIMDINFFGAIALTRPIVKRMTQRNKGHIAVVSSMLGLYGIQTRSAYSASKHALRGYFESLRNELFKTDVKITLIYPGYINTHITQNALISNGKSFGRNDEAHENGITPEECAKRIVKAINNKKPDVMIAGIKERFGAFMSRFFPSIFRYLSPKFEV